MDQPILFNCDDIQVLGDSGIFVVFENGLTYNRDREPESFARRARYHGFGSHEADYATTGKIYAFYLKKNYKAKEGQARRDFLGWWTRTFGAQSQPKIFANDKSPSKSEVQKVVNTLANNNLKLVGPGCFRAIPQPTASMARIVSSMPTAPPVPPPGIQLPHDQSLNVITSNAGSKRRYEDQSSNAYPVKKQHVGTTQLYSSEELQAGFANLGPALLVLEHMLASRPGFALHHFAVTELWSLVESGGLSNTGEYEVSPDVGDFTEQPTESNTNMLHPDEDTDVYLALNNRTMSPLMSIDMINIAADLGCTPETNIRN
jgi:hypothetical protein